jgi:xylose isomerase
MTDLPVFGAGIWHFATYKDRYATEGYGPPVGLLEQIDRAGAVGDLSVVDLNWPFAGFDGSLDDVKAALERNRLRAVAITPEIYNRDYVKGSITNPDPAVRSQTLKLLNEATELARELNCDYVKLWFGQDGWDYPFQVDYHDIWKLAVDGLRELVAAHPEIKFVIEYKPREPRNKIIFPNAARTLLAIQQVGLDNLGILLDFGHSLYGLETPADAAQLCIDAGRLSRSMSTTTSAAGTTTWLSARCTWWKPSSSSTRCARTTGTASGSLINSRSGRTAWPRPKRRFASSRPSTEPSMRWM